MDMIKYAGGSPANFLDVGGGASTERVAAAFRRVLGLEDERTAFIKVDAPACGRPIRPAKGHGALKGECVQGCIMRGLVRARHSNTSQSSDRNSA
jgi:succinyl-CoA synthetase beta subunit